ncbi:MAG TPA: Rieske 2Fe-2S domain-containing protein [Dehalococcoidia bacterium]|nr:Rieske 2Fe-2S domain-containing protein [Dehalococcoidia bacterium]
MLTQEDNEALTRVGPGTLMGNLMRQYWIPAMLSSELAAPDCPPLRLRLLAENLIAFRTTSGAVGVIVDACPHRGASMFFGRNEEEGLRCVYHGWKFDVTGACVDMPSEPAESNFKSKVRSRAYPCQERNGVVWVYMGPREVPPPLPQLEVNMLSDQSVRPAISMFDCNWLQAIEGDLDTGHLGFLHLGSVQPEDATPGSFDYYLVKDRAPRFEVIDTEVGCTYGAYRPAEEDTVYWRVAHFMFPFYTLIPTGLLGTVIRGQVWVPIDDGHTMYWGWQVSRSVAGRDGAQGTATNAATGRPVNAAGPAGRYTGFQYLPNTSDWLGRFRIDQNLSNDYQIDREVQARGDSYTGIRGIRQQDMAVQESMGPINNRTQEHLGTSDTMIIRTRRRLLRIARDLAEYGSVPPGVDQPQQYRQRSGSIILPRGVDWLSATEHLRKPNVPAGEPVLAGQIAPF